MKNISVPFYCIDKIMMMNKDNYDTREEAEWTHTKKHVLIVKMLEKIREGAHYDSNGFQKKDWLDIVRGFNQ